MDNPRTGVETAEDRSARRARFVETRNANAKVAREQRRGDLDRRAAGIERAVAAYRDLDPGDGTDITIRKCFVCMDPLRPPADDNVPYRRDDDLRSRPPLTRLINRRSNALSVYLSAVYVAHLESPAGTAVANTHENAYGDPSWITLTGLNGQDRPKPRKAPHSDKPQLKGQRNDPRANRLRNLTRALAELESHGLIQAGERTTGRFKAWSLRHEDGLGHVYEVPSPHTPYREALRVPYWFFRNGWHLVLTATEIATLFAVIERSQALPQYQRKTGIGLPTSERWARFGLSNEAYVSAHELHDFGVIDLVPARVPPPGSDPVELETSRMYWPSRRLPKEPIENRLALDVVREDLELELPSRMYPLLFDPRDYHNSAAWTPNPPAG
ncbi:hypothetical protein [Nocardia tengchongensis]|uniref:hypothetical protein n=1 Tax=Nocardia tengchongensis TaxID=2055889 RepID=UPI00369FABB4